MTSKTQQARAMSIGAQATGASSTGAASVAFIAVIAAAAGAVAMGAVAIGALAIGRLRIGDAAVRRLRIDELEVDQMKLLHVDGRRIVGSTDATRGCKHLCRHCPIVPVYKGRFRATPLVTVQFGRPSEETVRFLVAMAALALANGSMRLHALTAADPFDHLAEYRVTRIETGLAFQRDEELRVC